MTSLLASAVIAASIAMLPGTVVTKGGTYGKTDPESGATPMTPYCFPGVGGVVPCPCSNQPWVVIGPGCDNGATGGAYMDAWGAASINSDSLVIAVGDSLPTLHTLYVGSFVFGGAGILFGAGVRCVGSPVTVLAVGTPTSGPPSSITFTGIFAKSSAAGVPPFVGQTRAYFVGYSNPVMAVCNPSGAFNATNSGLLTWIQ